MKDFQAAYQPSIRAELLRQARTVSVPELHNACAHLLGLGKLYRPLLALAVVQCVKGSVDDRLIPFTTPLEMIHTSTLIHDDMPCMDDAELRRGKTAVHLAYGEETALLAGDALMNLGLLLPIIEDSIELGPAVRIRIVRALSAALHQAVEGQVLDGLGEGRQYDLDGLLRLHSKKTGALLGAACEVGAVLAGMDETGCGEFYRIGMGIGLAFQVRDDLLSMQSTESEMGKTLSSDDLLDKSTFPRILGVNGATEYMEKTAFETQTAIDSLGLKQSDLLKEMAGFALTRSN